MPRRLDRSRSCLMGVFFSLFCHGMIIEAQSAEPWSPTPSDPAQSVSIEGILKSDATGHLSLVSPQHPSVEIGDPSFAWRAQVLKNLKVVANVEPPVNGLTAVVNNVRLEAVARWSQFGRSHLTSTKALLDLNNSLSELDSTMQRLVSPSEPFGPGDRAELLRRTNSVRRDVVSAFMEISPSQTAERELLIDEYTSVRDTGKALYGPDNQYYPLAYPAIYQNSQGTVALVRTITSEPFCSGLVIGKSTVLTASHCLTNPQTVPKDIEVWLNYENTLDRHELPRRVFQVTGVLARGEKGFEPDGPPLDFVLLTVAPSGGNELGDFVALDCLSMKPVDLEDPIYVVGHPLGYPRTIADNAFVLFPFEVSASTLAELELSVEGEFKNDPQKDQRLKDLRNSYRSVHRADGSIVYQNYSVRWHRQPTIGADCETFHGDSGAPAFSRRSHLVVGILYDGEPDIAHRYHPGWGYHESIIPITRIVDQLDQAHPDWRTSVGACIK